VGRAPKGTERKPAVLTTEAKRSAAPRLEARVLELEQLDVGSISIYDDPRIEELSARIRSTLARIYGEDSLDFARLSDAAELNLTYQVLNLAGIDYPDGPSVIDIHNGLNRGRSRAISLLRAELDVLREDLAQAEATERPRPLPPALSTHTPTPPFEAVWSNAATRPKAFAEPTINDFLAMIDRPLQKAIQKAQLAVEQVKRDAARTGQTGNSVVQTFDLVRLEFDAAIKTVLGQLQHALTETNLDRSELRQSAVQRLMNFAIAAKSTTEPDRLKALMGSAGLSQYVDERLAAFDRDLDFEIRQFDVGLGVPSEPIDRPAQQARAPGITNSGSKEKGQSVPNKDVFIVHGRDELAKAEVARFIERAGLKAVILHEQPNAGRTIIEKFEAHGGSAGFAVVIATGDDVGGADRDHLQPRARQNVIGEMFWFAAKLGRHHVCVLVKGKIEMPSDFAGVGYTDMDARGAWKTELLKELEEAGYSIDWRRALA